MTNRNSISRALQEVHLKAKREDFYSVNVCENSSTHFTRSNYGYLNSIIIIIMVTATINENDKT